MCTVVNFQNLKVVQMEVENTNPSINPLISFSSLSNFLVFFFKFVWSYLSILHKLCMKEEINRKEIILLLWMTRKFLSIP